jgi:hypothetical protein
VFGTLLYAPFKTSFCVVGGVTSGLTLPFGGAQTAGKVATGQEPVRFVGGPSGTTVRDAR